MVSLPDRCAHCDVRHTALCSAMGDDELHALSAIARRRIVPHGQVVAWEGDRATVCANLVSGVLKLTSATPDGREAIVGLLFPGDFVGQLFVDEATVTVTALTDADLCYYPLDRFEAVLDDHARLERLLLQRTMAALEEARARMLVLGRQTAEEKVAGFLAGMADRLGHREGGSVRFDLPLTRGAMADLLGLTIETVSRQLGALKAAGAIETVGTRGIVIHDSGAFDARWAA